MTNACTWIGIGTDINRDSQLFEVCARMSDKLRAYGNRPTSLLNQGFHLNLYDLSVPTSDLNTVIESLNRAIGDQEKLEVPIRGIDSFPFGALFLELELIPGLQEMHERIVGAVSPLKGTCICEDYLEPKRKHSKEQLEMLRLHGNPHVLGQFKPHITLGFVPAPHLLEAQSDLASLLTQGIFSLDNIHVVTGDGSAKRALREWRLS